jgi:hypothetical protein
MTPDELIQAAIASFAGAILSGLLGWLDNRNTFDWRKAVGTLIRGVFAAVGFVSSNQFVEVQGAIWLWALVGGAGIDSLVGTVQNIAKSDQVKMLDLEKKILTISSRRSVTTHDSATPIVHEPPRSGYRPLNS